MARSKKPRKAYAKGKVLAGGNLPMGLSKANHFETTVLMAMQGMAQGFLSHGMAVELALFVTACSHVPTLPDEQVARVRIATNALSAVHDRYARLGRWGASGDDLRALEASVPPLLNYFKALPSAVVVDATWKAAQRFLK